MKPRSLTYEHFAQLLAYPSADYGAMVETLVLEAQDDHLSAFAAATKGYTATDFEELYTRTFDINPISSLEIGWHLYGETYERGSFLVKMRQLLKSLEIPESTELPDHLSHILQALEKLGSSDEANTLVAQYLAPALTKILDGFKEKSNPYEHLVLSLQRVLHERHLSGVETL